MSEENQNPVQPRFWVSEGSKETLFINDRNSMEPVCMVFVKHHPGMAEVICKNLNDTWAKVRAEVANGKTGNGYDH